MIRFTSRATLLAQLAKHGLEFDQKLHRALEIAASKPDLRPEDRGFPDSYLTLALYRLNSVLTQLVKLDESRLNIFHEYKTAPPCSADEVRPGERLCNVLDRAVALASPGKTIGTGHFLRAIASLTLDTSATPADGFPGMVLHNTFSAETLLWGMGFSAWTAVSDAPQLNDVLSSLDGRNAVEDVQYMMTFDGGRLVFRPTSPLGLFDMSAPGNLTKQREAVLTHFKDQFAAVTPDELLELEDLINNAHVREHDLQRFFERHTHFFRMWDYREVIPHVALSRDDDGPLIPDFLLLDRELQQAMIVDLKLPKTKTVISQKNRERFSASVNEARAQLLEYGGWFDDPVNRQRIKERVGMEIVRPHLGMIIGSNTEFRDGAQKQKLRLQHPDVEIVTYDDIAISAAKRLAIVQSAHR